MKAYNTSFVALLACLIGCGEARSQTIIAEQTMCGLCSITVERLVTLGDIDGPGALIRIPSSVAIDDHGRYYVATDDRALVFRPDGGFITSMGRPGFGPGELSGRLEILPVPGDSTLVLQTNQGRASLYGPDGTLTREVRLPNSLGNVVILSWPDTVLGVGILSDAGRFGWPLHLLSFAGITAQLLRSGGSGRNGEFVVADWRGVAVSANAPWWTLHRPYRVYMYDADLRTVKSFERRPDWWTENPDLPIGLPQQTPPDPRIKAATVDSDGLLWVFVNVAATNWREGWGDVPPGASEIPVSRVSYQKLFATLVEVIDPNSGTVIARSTIDDYVIKALPDRQAVAYMDDIGGVPQVSILRFTLNRQMAPGER